MATFGIFNSTPVYGVPLELMHDDGTIHRVVSNGLSGGAGGHSWIQVIHDNGIKANVYRGRLRYEDSSLWEGQPEKPEPYRPRQDRAEQVAYVWGDKDRKQDRQMRKVSLQKQGYQVWEANRFGVGNLCYTNFSTWEEAHDYFSGWHRAITHNGVILVTNA